MSDYEETVRLIADGELKERTDEMRTVHLYDGRTTIVDIQIKNEYAPGGWESIALGVARRRKGDRRNPELAGSLATYRALAGAAERHREAYERQFPGFFPKAPTQVREARAAVQYAHKQVDVAAEEIKRAQTALYEKRQMEERLAKALELLEKTIPFDLEQTNDQVTAAMRVLRGDSSGEE